MKNLALLILTGLFPLILLAQGSVKGKLVDTARQSLNNATISVLQQKDSSLVSYSISDTKGSFEIKNLPTGDYHLFVSFTGYEGYKNSFSITATQRVVDLGVIILQHEYKTLTGVVVTDASPVKMNGDTISFKANAFNSKPGATVEDVLKKIPGVQVQKDGSIRAMGEQVQKVYVDGKEFFGNDPKLATKNLTAEMVDQIQVFDDMSEQSRFTKIDDGSRTKSINIKLKKDRRKGDFGKASVGVGSNSRYEGNFSYNRFRGNKRISLVGSANNINKVSYNFSDYSSGQGGTSQFSGGGATGSGMINASSGSLGGISKPISTGINFNDTWGPKIDFRGSYFYSDNSAILLQDKFRRNSLPGDSASEVHSFSNLLNSNKTHRLNARWEYAIDSVNSILYAVNLGKQDVEATTIDTSVTFSDAATKYLAVKTNSDRHDERNGLNYSGELVYRRRFRKVGRTFTLGWRNNKSDNESNNTNRSPVTTYNSDGYLVTAINLNQHGYQQNESGGNTISASYTEPIGRNKLFEMNYAYSGNDNVSDKRTYDFNGSSGKYDLLNPLLSNYFEYKHQSDRAGFNFRHQIKKFNYQLGLGYQVNKQENRSINPSTGKDTTIRQRFTNLFPTANISYAITRSKNIRFYYRGRSNQPTVSQLQDVPDVSNPLLIKTGNPSLKQEFVNNININYNSFTTNAQRFFSASLSVNYTDNKIVNSIDSIGAVTIIYKPVNMDGSFSGSGMASLNFPVQSLKGFNINITNLMYLSRDANLLFKKKNFTNLFQVNQSAGINYGKDNFDMAISASVIYNRASYNLDKSSNTKYFGQAYSFDFTYHPKIRLYFLTDVDYYISSGRTEGYNEDAFLWNMSLAKKFFKINTAEIKFTVYDILKQNKGISRAIGENYFEDIRVNVIPSFFLISISYNLNRFGVSKDQKDLPAK